MISFVGAGPGAPDLLTLRAVQRLEAADVVVWAASLVPEQLLAHCRDGVDLHDSKRMTLDDVCAVYEANPGAAIVRLHSGDPAVYSAIGEQIAWCRANGRDYEVVPGVSSMAAAAAMAGVELTVPAIAQSVVMTRLARGTASSMPDRETITAFAAIGATMVVFLSVAQVEELTNQLLAPGTAYAPHTPVVVVHRASWPDQQLVQTDIGGMAAAVADAGFEATTLFLIGPALGDGADARPSHVYSGAYTTRFRDATEAAG